MKSWQAGLRNVKRREEGPGPSHTKRFQPLLRNAALARVEAFASECNDSATRAMALGELFLVALNPGINCGPNILWVLPEQCFSPGLDHEGVKSMGWGAAADENRQVPGVGFLIPSIRLLSRAGAWPCVDD